MARPRRIGFDYFPLDTDFFYDKKIKALKHKYPAEGVSLLIYIYCECYRDKGYYMTYDTDAIDGAACDINCETEKVDEVIKYMIEKGLIVSKSRSTGEVILTSQGIQKRYLSMGRSSKRNSNEIDEEISLISTEKTDEKTGKKEQKNIEKNTPKNPKNESPKNQKKLVNSEETIVSSEETHIIPEKQGLIRINSGFSTQSKGKKRKEKKYKGKGILTDSQKESGKNPLLSKQSFDEQDSPQPDRQRINFKGLIDCWNTTCTDLPKVQKLTEARKQKIRTLLKNFSAKEIREAFTMTQESDFLAGRKTEWSANFDWVIKTANMTKILEGNYTNKNETDTKELKTSNPYLTLLEDENQEDEFLDIHECEILELGEPHEL